MNNYSSEPISLDSIKSRLTISVEETAQLLGIGRTAAYEAARRGELPTRRIGKRIVIPVALLLKWLGHPTYN
jgi:excisionase family DNA binding protein